MDKYQKKYRIPSARHPHWDYRNNAAYFITICTHDREHYFGDCKNAQMRLSTIGAIVQGFWYDIHKHFPFVILGEFIVMPNHLHGILIINHNSTPPVETLHRNVSDVSAHKHIFFPRKIYNDSEKNMQHLNIDPLKEFNDYIRGLRGGVNNQQRKEVLRNIRLQRETLQCNCPLPLSCNRLQVEFLT